jgi:hypothetical protein
MKNKIRFVALSFAFAALGLSSCHKHDHVHPTRNVSWETTTVDSIISANHTLVMVLPDYMSEETPIISTEAKNASVSTLVKDSNTGNWVYTYTPITDYTGTDLVIFDSEEDEDEHSGTRPIGHGHHGKNHGDDGKCGSKDDDEDEYNRLVLNITINPAEKDQ